MVEFKWQDKNNTGIKEVDDQHKTMIAILNDLYKTMRAKKNDASTSKLLAKLSNYAQVHFATEERLLKTYNYPEYEKHKELHDIYRQKIKDFEKNYSLSKGTLVTEMASFISEWLIEHICGADQEFSSFLKEKMK